jgi:uncharacterized protein YbcC (UPF0753/DUF2309 family)
MLHGSNTRDFRSPDHPLARVIDRLAHLLPAQGPISIFIHHNTLHASEHMPFEDAVEHAAEQLGCEPFLAESRYRDKLASGRILAKDVEALLNEHLGAKGGSNVAGVASRFDLWRAVVLHGIPSARGRELSWILEETEALWRFRTDVPASARSALTVLTELHDRPGDERRAVRRLWNACLKAAAHAGEAPVISTAAPVRHRDWLHAIYGLDTDAWFHPPLIRFLAGYLDQGLAHWSMPGKSRGIHGCFQEIYCTSLAAQCGHWARTLPRIVAEDRDSGRSAISSIANSLAELGVSGDESEDYLRAELLALRGWAGIVRQIEERPDRVPARDITVTLRGYLAVRLLFERAALDRAARQLSVGGALSDLRPRLRQRLPRPPAPSLIERAWPLFHVAQLCGLDASIVEQWTAENVAEIESELQELDGVRRRRILHQAFERAIRHRLYDALMGHAPRERPGAPAFQALFCLDEREESFRRHLEEVEPSCETFSTAGFFNVAMYHQGVSDAHPRPLCPVAIRPEHYVAEIEPNAEGFGGRSRRLQRRAAGFLGYNVHLGSRLPVRGAVLMTAFGWLALVPLVLRVVFPWLSSRWSRVRETSTAIRTRLQLNREEGAPPIGTHSGFTVREMADIVRRVLEDIGTRDRLSSLVLVIGHGSISLNNPHESAHDCGACGGGRGGPNARAFSQMANDPRVRQLLAAEGLTIEATTWFVGAQRNTCNNAVTFFDEDLIPRACQPAFERAKEAIETARRREAHERCRRFDAVPRWYPPLAALAHVEGRAADLAQPRPEYGHATNAFCIIGRRTRTRGLFLDRRAFLVSYDPTQDQDGAVLARIMAAVIPVVAGISLEYYFSYVDPSGYGCGTKLPHNVTSLLGIMDGAQSDLRTGLPWQMVEIHEPTRLTIVVEATRDRVWQVVQDNPDIERLVRNRWLWVACLDPASSVLWELRETGFIPHMPGHALAVVTGESSAWYQGKRGFLPPVTISQGHSGAPDRHVTQAGRSV